MVELHQFAVRDSKMKYIQYVYKDAVASVAISEDESKESHAIIHTTLLNSNFEQQLNSLEMALASTAVNISKHIADVREEEGMEYPEVSPVFIRWFLSDIANQNTRLPRNYRCAVSGIQQSPLDGTKVAVWVVFRKGEKLMEISEGIWENKSGEIWVGDMNIGVGDSYLMTKKYMTRLDAELKAAGGSLADSCLRTWFMVRDIDVNYKGVVDGRNEVFNSLGLTPDTHFIASTGINGVSADPAQTVAFNAYADLNVTPDRITYLHGKSHLNRTAEYGVSFERATAVDYPACRRIYVSGTASIDNHGKIVHAGAIAAQTDRMLENIAVLLEEGGAGFGDVAHFIVYLRDIADYNTVSLIFAERFPDVPTIIVLAPVCRPGWLVEAECMASVTL